MARPNPLFIPELFHCILDGFYLPKLDLNLAHVSPVDRSEDLQETRKALAALAQTCHALSEPSLDRLWQRLDSLNPIIRSFSTTADRDKARVPPSPAEWAVIARYSHRVRELWIRTLVDDLFLYSASSCSHSPHLFPNLTVLRWSSVPTHDSDLTVIMDQLLSPSLVSLVASVERTVGIESFVQHYFRLCPRLELRSVTFDIQQAIHIGGKVSMSEIHQLSQTICIHGHLESLKVSIPLDDAALKLVILSPHLKTTALVLHPEESNLGNIRIMSVDIPFRNVKQLDLYVWDLHFVSSLLRPRNQMFHTLCLRLIGLHDAKTLSAFLTTLASPQRTDSLRSIKLTFENMYALSYEHINFNLSHDSAAHCLTYHTLRPLTSFKHLRKLVFNMFNQVFLNDEEFTDLARNWPMLEILVFASCYGSHVTSITLGGLSTLLALCPRLHKLNISVDARRFPEETSVAVCNTFLLSLKLTDSPIHDAHLVTAFFIGRLPFVRHVDVSFIVMPSLPDQPVEHYEWLWRTVNESLHVE